MLRVTYIRANNFSLQGALSKALKSVNHGRALRLELDGSTRTIRGMKIRGMKSAQLNGYLIGDKVRVSA